MGQVSWSFFEEVMVCQNDKSSIIIFFAVRLFLYL